MDDIGFWDIIVYAIAGLIIGALARLILPGKQSMSWGLTMVIGVVSAIIGGILWNAVFSGNEGVAWIGSLIVAIVIIVLYERVVAKRGGGSA
ncbi:MAG: GlsB/YeaQ/YmgE family stress response membrane protein [Actinomycetota bacterium]